MVKQNKVKIDNFEIAYLENNPEAKKTIFFLHGNSGSAFTWEKQIENSIFKNYRLIAFDLPGHGDSEKNVEDVKYLTPKGTGLLISKTIQLLANNQPFIIAGFSYGTNILAEALRNDLQPDGLILISSSVIGAGLTPQDVFKVSNDMLFFKDEYNIEDVLDFFTREIKTSKTIAKAHALDFINTGKQTRSTIINAALSGVMNHDLEKIINYKRPILIIFGGNDSLVQTNYLDKIPIQKWDNRIFCFENAGHFVHIDAADEINELILNYLNNT